MMERRGSWYLLTGFILGVVGGLVYAWVISPVKYIDAAPNALREDFKDQYRALIAAVYSYTGHLARAQARLDKLGDENSAQALALQAQRALSEGRPENETRNLGLLALALSPGSADIATTIPIIPSPSSAPGSTQSPTALSTQTELPPTPSPAALPDTPLATSATRTSAPTPTLLPSRTPTPTQGAPFVLLENNLDCSLGENQPLIWVDIRDASDQPVPGVEVVVSWEDGEDHFFTGLKPELGLGYADFSMSTGITYTVQLADGGQPVPDLVAAECENEDGERQWGAWHLVFIQP